MARSVRPATAEDVALVQGAIVFLKGARYRLKTAGCPEAAKAVRIALKSAEGALRHAESRLRRSSEVGP